LIYYISLQSKNKLKLFFLILMVLFSFNFIFKLPFMTEKIYKTYLMDTDVYSIEKSLNSTFLGYKYAPNRFASFYIDFIDFTKDPIFGRGINQKTRYFDKSENLNLSNGLSSWLVTFGLCGFILLIFNLYKSLLLLCNEYKSKYPIFIVTGILIMAFSEPLLYTPLLFSIQYYYLARQK